MQRKRKLSPSGSKARIVQEEDGTMYALITGAQEKCARLSFGAMSLLYGMLKAVMAETESQPPVKPPVRRRLDFEYVIDIQTETDDEDCIIP